MTTLVANYVFSPLSGLLSSFDRFTQTIGYSRAAAELARMGMIEEAKKCMLEMQKLQYK